MKELKNGLKIFEKTEKCKMWGSVEELSGKEISLFAIWHRACAIRDVQVCLVTIVKVS